MKETLFIDIVLLFILISDAKYSPEMHVSSVSCGAVTQHTRSSQGDHHH